MFSRVHAFDLRVDALVERIRRPQLDPVFYGLSSAADHGLLWLFFGASRAARAGDPAVALRMGAALGVESMLTNGPIKACFRRVRPADEHPPEGPLPYGMHRPISSSFPSGHAASAFAFAGAVAGTVPVLGAPLRGLATAVAYSRVHTGVHYPGDVIVGSVVGATIGEATALATRALRRRRDRA
jgi:membrane-associated phospholipid phosphatase